MSVVLGSATVTAFLEIKIVIEVLNFKAYMD